MCGACVTDPKHSGHYDRYRLLVGYLLQERRLSIDELLAQPLDRTTLEYELLAER